MLQGAGETLAEPLTHTRDPGPAGEREQDAEVFRSRAAGGEMKFIDFNKVDRFTSDKPHRELLYDSPNLRVLSFNLEPGQELPVHSHSTDSDIALIVLEGEGEFTGAHEMPARAGQSQIMPVAEPHGLKAHTRLRLLVVIAPTL